MLMPNLEFNLQLDKLELNMPEGHSSVSKYEIWAGVFCAIPKFCSAAEYAAALKDIPATGATFGSYSTPSFSPSDGFTDLNTE